MGIGAFNRKISKFTEWALLFAGLAGGITVGIIALDLPGAGDGAAEGRDFLKMMAGVAILMLISLVSLLQILKRRRLQHEKRQREMRSQNLQYIDPPRDLIKPPLHRVKRGPRG